MPNLANMSIEETQAAIRTEATAQQNDRFRRAMCGKLDHEDDKGLAIPSGRIVYTQGIDALGHDFLMEAMRLVSEVSEFSEDNDPYGSHEFASIDVPHEGQTVKIFWKIDAYDTEFKYGSPDPADPKVTRRVLTLLLPSEY